MGARLQDNFVPSGPQVRVLPAGVTLYSGQTERTAEAKGSWGGGCGPCLKPGLDPPWLWMLVRMRSHGPSKAPVSPRKPRSLGPCFHAPSPECGPASAGEQGPHTCSWVPPHCDFPPLTPSQPLAPESPQDTFWATSSKWEESGGAPVAKSSHFYFLLTKPPRPCSANVSKAWTLADWSGYLGPKTTF